MDERTNNQAKLIMIEFDNSNRFGFFIEKVIIDGYEFEAPVNLEVAFGLLLMLDFLKNYKVKNFKI